MAFKTFNTAELLERPRPGIQIAPKNPAILLCASGAAVSNLERFWPEPDKKFSRETFLELF